MILAIANYIVPSGLIVVIIGVSGWLIIHSRNHLVKKDIDKSIGQLWNEKQSTKFCDERTQRIEEKIDGVDSKLETGFANISNLISQIGK